ncbi:O-antigen ligase family protein [Ramlibacter sp. AW1]|uniref:O-antigen ligase family protein n=1 Tax=Ramlibacter aurantiacus TaxID=2801330 RepID=A0A936ZKJ6_9BURK|nr:O-antigen ligase family protein [Ramlibacter aurantiacus]MBL0418915.1 O-antigen ligase family protein [Ramlibacter aurantiacus]
MSVIPYDLESPAAPMPARLPQWVGPLLAFFTLAVLFSTALTNIMAVLVSAAAVWIWARMRPLQLLKHPLLWSCLVLVGWIALRDALAAAAPQQVLQSVASFRTLLFIALWAPLFLAPQVRQAVLKAGVGGLAAFALLTLSVFALTGQMPYPGYVSPDALWPLGLDPMMASLVKRAPNLAGPVLLVVIFGSLQHVIDHPQRRRWLILLAALCTLALFVSSMRRSSQLGFLVCAFAFAVLNRRHLKGRTAMVGAACIAVVLTLAALGPARHALQRVVDGSEQFILASPQERNKQQTSESERLHFWTVAQQIVIESPWVGTSVSSYLGRYLKIDSDPTSLAPRHGNPHNEYLYVWGSLGAVGLALYLLTLVSAWRCTGGHPGERKLMAYYLAAVLPNLAANSYVVDMVPGHVHTLVLLLLAGPALQAAAARGGR